MLHQFSAKKKSLGILRYKQNEEFLRLHVCCICLEIFKVAIFHQGKYGNNYRTYIKVLIVKPFVRLMKK